ncbi:MAG TPA: hypothetical protein VHD85_19890, partial [Terracidiphilus sp.]|nr:hypothetical protein [Terracidiphilus sp.]
MVGPSLHPESARATCNPRGRLAFGLTSRAILLLAAGLLLALPGFFSARLSLGMLAWDALVLVAIFLDARRLPAARLIAIERSWSNAPSLDSETEIELTVEHTGSTILDCRLIDDLPIALTATPATHNLQAFPG